MEVVTTETVNVIYFPSCLENSSRFYSFKVKKRSTRDGCFDRKTTLHVIDYISGVPLFIALKNITHTNGMRHDNPQFWGNIAQHSLQGKHARARVLRCHFLCHVSHCVGRLKGVFKMIYWKRSNACGHEGKPFPRWSSATLEIFYYSRPR